MASSHAHNRYFGGPIVVFGATGFLGTAIVRELLRVARGGRQQHGPPRIVCVVRSSNLGPGLAPLAPFVDVRRVDHVTEDSLNDLYYNALRGDIRAFIHVAGIVRHSADESEIDEMYASNVVLSDTIFSFAEKHNIRTVYASSSGVVGCQFIEDKFRVAHDDGPLCTDTIKGLPFYEHKAQIEAKWRPRAAEGRCPVVFLRPSLLLGPGDDRLSSSKVVLDYIQGRMTFLPKGGISFMDVRDCAQAFVMALLCDESVVGGTVMNLTAANIPFHEFASILEEVTGVQAPKVELPSTIARVGGTIASRYNAALGKPRDDGSDPIYIEIGQRFWNVSCQRALQLLEFDPRDPSVTLREAAKYLHHTYGAATVSRNVAIGSTAGGSTARRSSVGGASGESAAAMAKRRSSPMLSQGQRGSSSATAGGSGGRTGALKVTPRRVVALVVMLLLLLIAFFASSSATTAVDTSAFVPAAK